jgi:replicative DNA helicase
LRLSDISHSEIQQEIMDIFAEDSHQNSTISLEEAIKGLIDTPEADGIKTGFLGLDNLLGGFNKGEMVVIAARPSIGKSALALSMIKNMANENISGLYISLEMSYKELAKRLILIDIQKDDIFLNNIFDYQKYEVELVKLYELPIYIVNEYNSSISGILKVASNLIRTRNIGILFIDHVQLVFSGKKAENRNLELSGITSILKQFALKENIVAVVLSQVGRQCDGRMPTLSDLRDSGAIEQDADKVILLNRPAFYGISTYENGVSTAGICDLKIAKNRNGPIGESRLKFLEKYTAFENP